MPTKAVVGDVAGEKFRLSVGHVSVLHCLPFDNGVQTAFPDMRPHRASVGTPAAAVVKVVTRAVRCDDAERLLMAQPPYRIGTVDPNGAKGHRCASYRTSQLEQAKPACVRKEWHCWNYEIQSSTPSLWFLYFRLQRLHSGRGLFDPSYFAPH